MWGNEHHQSDPAYKPCKAINIKMTDRNINFIDVWPANNYCFWNSVVMSRYEKAW